MRARGILPGVMVSGRQVQGGSGPAHTAQIRRDMVWEKIKSSARRDFRPTSSSSSIHTIKKNVGYW